MVFYCSAYNCKNSTKDKSLSFHAFPLHNPKLLKTWLKNLRWKDWTPASHSKLCSVHFEKKCFMSEGKRIRLTPGAVPTIFTFSNRKAKIDPRSRRALGIVGNLNPSHPAVQNMTADSEKLDQSSSENSAKKRLKITTEDPQNNELMGQEERPPWTILGNYALDKSMTISSFFHSGYCLPKNLRWAGDDDLNIMPHVVYGVPGQTEPHIIEVKERWEWLGLDVRGPFPPTVNKHTHIMTLTDYHSKWAEAFPLTDKLSKDVAVCLVEVIQQQGYPLGILSRLPKGTIVEINRELKKRLRLNANSLVIHHRQTGYLDLVTESLLNEMLDDLVKKNKGFWHVALPAATLNLCCMNHPTTREKPFTHMYAKEPAFSSSPRQLPYNATDIRLSSFVISSTEASNLRAVTETLVQLRNPI
ncbi:uncharacterized protein zgc:163143 isoform X1 [Triplophysa rosa]|uniref:THAP domain-containing protein 1 n=2 Tax=Triplophysa rosa TaxID=992332 RepID=A0A9W7TVX1_TRIRA|nr:uncharacterized protein zgc:163143 isoform X1 [Triplophysa rosa]KAI7803154.1 hypothetical protein IRJ41_003428 [Triplophysa rosa]